MGCREEAEMLKQIRYFQAVVRNNSFSKAAEECFISQSAISQQIQALELQLGIQLLERKNRKFNLTPAGEYFYRKSLILVADYEQLCRETARIAHAGEAVLRIGYLRSYSGNELHGALDLFARKYPDVSVQIKHGNHEELYELLVAEKVDMALSDQRRMFSDAFVNIILETVHSSIEISKRSPLAALEQITPSELKSTPCILVASETQQETEREYCTILLAFTGSTCLLKIWKRQDFWRLAERGLCLWRVGQKRRALALQSAASRYIGGYTDYPELLSVLGKRQFWILYRRICRSFKITI